jgi:hypothetical protein
MGAWPVQTRAKEKAGYYDQLCRTAEVCLGRSRRCCRKPARCWPRPRARSRDASATFRTVLEDDPDTVLIYEQYRDAKALAAHRVGALQTPCRGRALPEDAGAERGEPGCSRLSQRPRPTVRDGRKSGSPGDGWSGDTSLPESVDRRHRSGLPSLTIMPAATIQPFELGPPPSGVRFALPCRACGVVRCRAPSWRLNGGMPKGGRSTRAATRSTSLKRRGAMPC